MRIDDLLAELMPGWQPLSGVPALLDNELSGFGFIGYSFDLLNQTANTAPTAGDDLRDRLHVPAGQPIQGTVWATSVGRGRGRPDEHLYRRHRLERPRPRPLRR
jgi:hypothetical protein